MGRTAAVEDDGMGEAGARSLAQRTLDAVDDAIVVRKRRGRILLANAAAAALLGADELVGRRLQDVVELTDDGAVLRRSDGSTLALALDEQDLDRPGPVRTMVVLRPRPTPTPAPVAGPPWAPPATTAELPTGPTAAPTSTPADPPPSAPPSAPPAAAWAPAALAPVVDREGFRRHLAEALGGAPGSPDELVGVLLVRLGGPDEGHDLDDARREAVTTAVRHAAGADAVVAGLRADELAVLQHGTSLVHFVDGADRVRAALAAVADGPDGVGGSGGCAIGISALPPGEATVDRLLREADAAATRALGRGPDRTELFDQDLRRTAQRRREQATALRRAIAGDELVVAWQASMPLRPDEGDDAEVWAEALVRWRNPERGMVSPGNFIELAEDTGLIVEVGGLVRGQAFRQLASWRSGPDPRPRRVAVNLSPRELAHDGLTEAVAAALDAAGVPPAAVILEFTEAALRGGDGVVLRHLHDLRDLGVALALDDFGVGSAPLGELRHLPVSVLKIDQSFIRGLDTSRADWAIVRAIVEMGHGLGLTVVAEGVETAEQCAQVTALGCDRAQGYHWSSPVAADALDRLLDARPAPV